jgi:hypothetical protein
MKKNVKIVMKVALNVQETLLKIVSLAKTRSFYTITNVYNCVLNNFLSMET